MKRPVGLLAALLAPLLLSAAAPRPNILIILADDLGRGDYGAADSPDLQTPHLDRLAREGLTFQNWFANSPVCSPTRAALLTGCYPDRVGVPGVIRVETPADSWGFLQPGIPTLPQALAAGGYHSALIGKWHLGTHSPNTPTERGFDFFHGFLGDMMDDYWTHQRHGLNWMRRNQEVIAPEGHATDLFTAWACQYLEDRARASGPFFLYLAYNAPHSPIQPPPAWLAQVQQRHPELSPARAQLAALIEHLDHGVGQVLETLERCRLAENTLVVFTSDNGGQRNLAAHNGPWRGGKGEVYEGGLRVPGLARWPGKIAPNTATDRLTLTLDLFPTACAAAAVPVPAGIDGRSFLPTLEGRAEADAPRDLYFVRREGGPAFGGKTIEALRRGDWKLLQNSPYAPSELYNLRRDPGETTNLADEEPEIRRQLQQALSLHLQRGGQVPWQSPAAEPPSAAQAK